MPLIAVEGADAVGKSTQVERLAAFLLPRAKSKGVALRCLHLPRLEGGYLSMLIKKFLTGTLTTSDTLDPQLVALLFACDRYDLRPQLQRWLAEGDIVLMDRYVASNVAYQSAKISDALARAQLQEWIEKLEYELFALPRPDVTLCFDAPLAFSAVQLAARRRKSAGAGDVHEIDLALQQRVRQAYEDIAAAASNFHIISCGADAGGEGKCTMRSVEDIAAEVREKLAEMKF